MGQQIAFIVLVILSVMIFSQLLLTKWELKKEVKKLSDSVDALKSLIGNS